MFQCRCTRPNRLGRVTWRTLCRFDSLLNGTHAVMRQWGQFGSAFNDDPLEVMLKISKTGVANPAVFVWGCPAFVECVSDFRPSDFGPTELTVIMIPVGTRRMPRPMRQRDPFEVRFRVSRQSPIRPIHYAPFPCGP